MTKLQRLLAILDLALSAVGGVLAGPIGADIKLADVFVKIFVHANAAYQAETGQPLDLTKIPPEQPIP